MLPAFFSKDISGSRVFEIYINPVQEVNRKQMTTDNEKTDFFIPKNFRLLLEHSYTNLT